jgi:hypothetical protein
MLKRREFIRLSTVLAAGAVLPLAAADNIRSFEVLPVRTSAHRPLYRLHGHKKSGCAFCPELVDIWSGGGAVLPGNL